MALTCKNCNIEFTSNIELNNHSKKFHNFGCEACNHVFEDPRHLQGHFLNEHTECQSRCRTCLLCDAQFSSRTEFYKHVHGHTQMHEHMCTQCTKSFCDKRDVVRHERVHNGEKPYACTKCDRKYPSKRSLASHMRITHENIPKRKNKPIGGFKCDICNKSLSTAYSLKAHKQIHSSFTCKLCGATIKKRKEFELHLLAHKGSSGFSCEQCDSWFSSKSTLNFHVRAVHCKQNDRVSCDHCDRTFATKKHLRVHLRRHTGEKLHTCCECDEKFFTSGELKCHAIKQHGAESPYICPICKKTFAASGSLLVHKRTHTNVKAYKCNICGRGFQQKTVREDHLQSVHFNSRRFKCFLCNRRFNSRTTLQRHVRVHTGEKRHTCHVCKARFARSCTLNSHMRQVHSKERPFVCRICGRAFKMKTVLQTHVARHRAGGKVVSKRLHPSEVDDSEFLAAKTSRSRPIAASGEAVPQIRNKQWLRCDTVSQGSVQHQQLPPVFLDSEDSSNASNGFSLMEIARVFSDPVEVAICNS